MNLLELEEREPFLDLQAKVSEYLEFIRRLCYQLHSPYFLNYWIDRVTDTFTIAGKEHSIDKTAYQILVILFDRCSSLILSHVNASKDCAYDLLKTANELHGYLSNVLVALDCQYQHLKCSVIDNVDILRYEFSEFIEQKGYLDEADGKLIDSRLEAELLQDVENKLNMWVAKEVENRKDGKNFSKKKETELKAQIMDEVQFKTYHQQVETDLKMKKNRKLIQIVDLSMKNPEQLEIEGISPVKCKITPEEVQKIEEAYELKEHNEQRIRKMQKADTIAVKREAIPLLYSAIAWLERIYTDIVLLREQRSHEVSILYYKSTRKFEGMVQSLSDTESSKSGKTEEQESLY